MGEEKTFTQEQLDAIVKERLAKEKAKFDSAHAEKEKELQAREFQIEAKEVLTKKGLPLDLLDALNTSSREAFDRSIAIIEEKLKTSPSQSETAATTRVSTGGSHNEYGTTTGDKIRTAMGL